MTARNRKRRSDWWWILMVLCLGAVSHAVSTLADLPARLRGI